MITLIKKSHGYDVFSPVGGRLGLICFEIDGYHVFWPRDDRQGFWTAANLHSLASKLDELNTEWDKTVKEATTHQEVHKPTTDK